MKEPEIAKTRRSAALRKWAVLTRPGARMTRANFAPLRARRVVLLGAALLGILAHAAEPGTPPVETTVTPPGTTPPPPNNSGTMQPGAPQNGIETTVTPRRQDPLGPTPQPISPPPEPIAPPLPPVLRPPKVSGSAPLSTEVPVPAEPSPIDIRSVESMATDVPPPEPPQPIRVESPGSP